jgi:hypothetical protein
MTAEKRDDYVAKWWILELMQVRRHSFLCPSQLTTLRTEPQWPTLYHLQSNVLQRYQELQTTTLEEESTTYR